MVSYPSDVKTKGAIISGVGERTLPELARLTEEYTRIYFDPTLLNKLLREVGWSSQDFNSNNVIDRARVDTQLVTLLADRGIDIKPYVRLREEKKGEDFEEDINLTEKMTTFPLITDSEVKTVYVTYTAPDTGGWTSGVIQSFTERVAPHKGAFNLEAFSPTISAIMTRAEEYIDRDSLSEEEYPVIDPTSMIFREEKLLLFMRIYNEKNNTYSGSLDTDPWK